MKLLNILAIALLVSCSAQKKQEKVPTYITIGYSSICCGTPSEKPVNDFIRTYSKTNESANIKVYRQSGLGREGEFNLYVDIGNMSEKQRKTFLEGLDKVIENQNKAREVNSDGLVALSKETLSQAQIDEQIKQRNQPIVEILQK